MNPEPKFVPGELVVLAQSNFYPELVGGIFQVESAEWREGPWGDGGPSQYGYKLVGVQQCKRMGDDGRILLAFWVDKQLRKLPGTLLGDMSSLSDIWVPKAEGMRA